MAMSEITQAAAQLLTEFGDVQSAERAAAARIQTSCNANERGFWGAVQFVLAATEDARSSQAETREYAPREQSL